MYIYSFDNNYYSHEVLAEENIFSYIRENINSGAFLIEIGISNLDYPKLPRQEINYSGNVRICGNKKLIVINKKSFLSEERQILREIYTLWSYKDEYDLVYRQVCNISKYMSKIIYFNNKSVLKEFKTLYDIKVYPYISDEEREFGFNFHAFVTNK
jgi:hypothetical protein